MVNESKKGGIFAMALALVLPALLLGMVGAGCVSSAEAANPGAGGPSGGTVLAGDPNAGSMGAAGEVAAGGNGAVVADSKTGYDKTQDTIAQAIADGTYVEDVTYSYHAGNETMKVSVTVENDIITGASITPQGTPAPYSLKMMEAVNGSLPNLVVGKKITELDIPKNVAGSSLTTAAFKEQLALLVEKY